MGANGFGGLTGWGGGVGLGTVMFGVGVGVGRVVGVLEGSVARVWWAS